MQQPIDRRGFLKRASAGMMGAAATIIFAVPALARRQSRKSNSEPVPYYVLDPEHGAGDSCPTGGSAAHDSGGDCHGCRACHLHAKNKLFATDEAANAAGGRAHVGCKCVVREGGTLPRNTWTALFGRTNSPDIPSVDLRHPSTRRILEQVN